MGFSLKYFFEELLIILEDMEKEELNELISYVKDQQAYAKSCGMLE